MHWIDQVIDLCGWPQFDWDTSNTFEPIPFRQVKDVSIENCRYGCSVESVVKRKSEYRKTRFAETSKIGHKSIKYFGSHWFLSLCSSFFIFCFIFSCQAHLWNWFNITLFCSCSTFPAAFNHIWRHQSKNRAHFCCEAKQNGTENVRPNRLWRLALVAHGTWRELRLQLGLVVIYWHCHKSTVFTIRARHYRFAPQMSYLTIRTECHWGIKRHRPLELSVTDDKVASFVLFQHKLALFLPLYLHIASIHLDNMSVMF